MVPSAGIHLAGNKVPTFGKGNSLPTLRKLLFAVEAHPALRTCTYARPVWLQPYPRAQPEVKLKGLSAACLLMLIYSLSLKISWLDSPLPAERSIK